VEEYRNIYEWSAPESGCAIALGRFDGVHVGHRTLLERTVEHALKRALVPVCFSFQESTYPGADLRGQLTTAEEKAEILAEIGIGVHLHPAFQPPLTEMQAGEFLHSVLVDRWHARLIVVGFDFRFGKDRIGDADFLRREGDARGIEIEIIEPFNINGELVKATRIRELISEGAIEYADILLGRPYSITGRPRTGRRFGTSIGFPTINFPFPGLKVRPPLGVYVVRMIRRTEAPSHNGVANFGVRPTTDPENREPLLEVHILDPTPRAVDPVLPPSDAVFKVEFLRFLRPERRFDSIEELKQQIARDCESAREFFDSE